MDSIADLLSKKDYDTPDELKRIKRYVQETYQVEVEVQQRSDTITVAVPSAALATNLRYDTPKIQRYANTTKRLVLRIVN